MLHSPFYPLLIAERRRVRAPRRVVQRARIHPRVHLNRYAGALVFIFEFARFNLSLGLSTDYVFDGTSPPYVPSAQPNPVNLYSTTKRDAELAVLGIEGAHVAVLRVPIL